MIQGWNRAAPDPNPSPKIPHARQVDPSTALRPAAKSNKTRPRVDSPKVGHFSNLSRARCASDSPTSQQPYAERHRDTAQTPRCHGMLAPPLMPPSTRTRPWSEVACSRRTSPCLPFRLPFSTTHHPLARALSLEMARSERERGALQVTMGWRTVVKMG